MNGSCRASGWRRDAFAAGRFPGEKRMLYKRIGGADASELINR